MSELADAIKRFETWIPDTPTLGPADIPFLTEAYLYDAIGKEDARTLLALWKRVVVAMVTEPTFCNLCAIRIHQCFITPGNEHCDMCGKSWRDVLVPSKPNLLNLAEELFKGAEPSTPEERKAFKYAMLQFLKGKVDGEIKKISRPTKDEED